MLCVLESNRKETSESYKNLQQEEADWALCPLLLSRSLEAVLEGRGMQLEWDRRGIIKKKMHLKTGKRRPLRSYWR
jgi:hypothetical protein